MPHSRIRCSRTQRSHTTHSSITIIASIASFTVAAETTSTLATTIVGAGFGPRMDRSGLMSATTATKVLGTAANLEHANRGAGLIGPALGHGFMFDEADWLGHL